MATFARAQFLAGSDGIDPATRAITPTAATSLLIAVLSERSGTGHTPHTMSDGGATGGDWVKVFGWDQQLGDSNARHSFSLWWKVAGSTAAITVSGDDGTGNGKRLSVHEYTTDTAGTWSVVSGAAVGADTGTGSSSPLAIGPTGSAPAGDNLVLLSINWRTAGDQAYPGTATNSFLGLTTTGAGSNGRQHGTAWQQDAAGGTFSTSVDWTGDGHEAAGGIVVFALDGGGGGSQTLTPPLLTRSKTIYAPTVTGGVVTLTPPLLTRSKTIYTPTLTGGAVTAQTGLLFALNGAVDSMARIEWPSHTDAMALRKACTFIYEYETDASQVGYGAQVWFSTEGWTGDGPGWNAGFHSAYPCNLAYDATGQATGGTGSSGTTHAPEIAGLGSHDYIHTPTGSSGTAAASYKGTRRRAAVVLEDVGSNIRHTFYYNLPSTTDKIVIDFDQATLDGYSVPDALLRLGSSPWTDNTPFSGRNEETANGLLRFFKVFDVPLSESDMLTEAAAESNTPATTAGLASVYYANINPTVADISDKSGAGNDPAWANAQRPADWSAQVVTPPLLTRTKTIFVPSVSQEGVTLSPPLLTRAKTLYAPSVAVGTVNLTPPLLTRTKTIYAPVVSQAGAPQIVAPGLLTRAKVLYSPVVVPGEVDVAPPLLTRTKVLYSPTISTGYGITPPLLTRSKTIYASTITVGGVTLSPPLLTRSKALYFPTLTGGDTPVATGGVFWPTVRRRRR